MQLELYNSYTYRLDEIYIGCSSLYIKIINSAFDMVAQSKHDGSI